MFNRLFVAPLVALALAAPAQAGLFKKSPKPDPAVYVPALIETLKSDKEEKNRAAAASELDEFDAKAFPDILPALMSALASDPSSSVRSRAAESIGKVRPITAAAGYALEQAIADDKNFAVRISARTALLKYKVLGHMPGTKIEGVVQSSEPPLAIGTAAKDVANGTVLQATPQPVPTEAPAPVPTTKPPADSHAAAPTPFAPQSGEPPLALPGKPAVPAAAPKAPAPVIVIPSTPSKDVVVPVPTTPTSGGPALPPKN